MIFQFVRKSPYSKNTFSLKLFYAKNMYPSKPFMLKTRACQKRLKKTLNGFSIRNKIFL